MIVTPATAKDAPALAALVNAAYRGEAARAGWTHEADLLAGQRTDAAALAALIAAVPGALLVARERDGGPPVGCVAVAPEGAEAWSLGMLSVDPRRQAGGIGRTLIAAAERHAAARGARRMKLTVIGSRATLIAYYERRGFRLTGEQQPFPYGDARVGVPLVDGLGLHVMAKAI